MVPNPGGALFLSGFGQDGEASTNRYPPSSPLPYSTGA